ncbi:hypothetical protein ACNQGP_14075 [Flavobacterium sp. GT2N3]|uniref:hypothetical protein n=1 Tax=unclassified Flavobacterium TaxID=196869 RepID=UPI003AB04F20
MSAIELKKLLISKIAEIDDEVFLLEINAVLDSKSERIIALTQNQIDDILISRIEIKNGLGIDNDDLDLEITKWLQEE